MIRFIYFTFIFLLFACTNQEKVAEQNKGEQIAFHYAEHFTVKYDKKGAVIEILNPEGKGIERSLHPLSHLEENLKIIAMSSTHIGMLEKIGLAENIVGVSDIQYVANKTVLKNYKAGKVVSNPSFEQIVQSKANVVFYDGFGKEFPHQKQLEQLKIQCIQIYDWRELHPLGKAEWIMFFGTFLDKQEEAMNYFNSVVSEYKVLKSSATKLKNKEDVLSGNLIGDLWYTPAGKSYNAQLFADANCNYNYSTTEGTGSLALTIEEVIQKNANCSIWINPGFDSYAKLKTANPKANYFQAFNDKNVYCYTKNGNYFWEMSAIEPHKVLSDIIQITHPDLKATKKLYFYSKLK